MKQAHNFVWNKDSIQKKRCEQNLTSFHPASLLDPNNEAFLLLAVQKVERTLLVKRQRPLVASLGKVKVGAKF